MVYRLVVEDTVEQKMVELGQRKREVAESALGRDHTAGTRRLEAAGLAAANVFMEPVRACQLATDGLVPLEVPS